MELGNQSASQFNPIKIEENNEENVYDTLMNGLWDEIQKYYPGSYKRTKENMDTIVNIAGRGRRRVREGTTRYLHDQSSPRYGWLPVGWFCEERTVQKGRLYRYYYDPEGFMYDTLCETIQALERRGIVVLDF